MLRFLGFWVFSVYAVILLVFSQFVYVAISEKIKLNNTIQFQENSKDKEKREAEEKLFYSEMIKKFKEHKSHAEYVRGVCDMVSLSGRKKFDSEINFIAEQQKETISCKGM